MDRVERREEGRGASAVRVCVGVCGEVRWRRIEAEVEDKRVAEGEAEDRRDSRAERREERGGRGVWGSAVCAWGA